MFGSRILILAPHPDDEIVACGAAIGRAQAMGAKIFVLFLTHGCPGRDILWPWQRGSYEARVAQRLCEAEDAASLLRVTPAGFSNRPTRHIRRDLPQVAQEILKAVATYGIDQLWVPAYEGGHADHDALNGLCAKLQDRLPPIFEFSEYNFAGGKKHSNEFPAPNGAEQIMRLSGREQILKQLALGLYVSEKKNLNYVRTDQENFRPLASYDYAKPPHEGKVWYARFHWVPFAHPRIDFTKPADVSATLASFEPASVLPESATP